LHVTILVLGDLGRSPRMLNHALMLAKTGWQVSLVGYKGAPVDPAIANHPGVRLFFLSASNPVPAKASKLIFLARSLWKITMLFVGTTHALLFRTPRPDVILVQNPPSIPTLLIARIAASLRGARFIIDWHNFGYSMLALRLGNSHAVVRLALIYEKLTGSWADAHFCVSRAMQEVLTHDLRIPGAVVLYDRPRDPVVAPRPGRTSPDPLLVSPTSWTADEPMDILIDALDLWDRHDRPCRLRIVISGRGALREPFERAIAKKSWRHAEVQTVFLDTAAYRGLLREADLGLSFHRSTSGIDLPMKIIDLLGAGTPVCAFDYGPCLQEQLHPGQNGLLFRTAEELAAHFEQLFGAYPGDDSSLRQLRNEVEAHPLESWSEVWLRVAAPVFTTPPDTRKS
jgi:beta-1,4-mannosyltransferase